MPKSLTSQKTEDPSVALIRLVSASPEQSKDRKTLNLLAKLAISEGSQKSFDRIIINSLGKSLAIITDHSARNKKRSPQTVEL